MKKLAKDLLKDHPNHQFCDFGMKEFGQTKRNKDFVDSANAAKNGGGGKPDKTAPTTPTGLAVTSVTSSSISIKWNPSSDNVGVKGYTLTINGGSPISVTTLSYTFTGLLSNTTYTLAVKAFDAAGNYSGTASIQAATAVQINTCPDGKSTYTTDINVCPKCADGTFTPPSGCTCPDGVTKYTTDINTCPKCPDGTFTPPGGCVTPPPPPPPPPLPTATIGASPISIISGSTSTLSWTTANATIVSIDNSIGTVAANGSLVVSPTSTTTYILTATNSTGSVQAQVTVTVSAPPPPPPPSDAAVILLDFNGQTVSGTSWNVNGDIVCDYSGLTDDEISIVVANITAMYAAYNVVITTDESVFSAANVSKRQRVIFTETWEWYGQAGGVAFINSMFGGTDTPCFVFTSLLSYNTRTIWAAGAHEAGHTIGLHHQSVYDVNCVKTSEYNSGNSTCGCAPVMGVAYSRTPLWWIGPNSVPCSCSTCGVWQDDNAIITTKIGLHP